MTTVKPGSTGSPREHRALVRNVVSSYGVRGVQVLGALLLTPYLFRRLGADGFGTWSVMFTMATVAGLLELGPTAATTKFVAEYRSRRRPQDVDDTVGASVLMMIGFGVLTATAMACMGLLLPSLAAASERTAFRDGMLILAAAMLIRFPLVAYGAALTGLQRFDLFRASEVVTIGGSTVGAVIAIEVGAGVLGLAVAYAAGFVVGAILYAVLLRRAAPEIALRPRAVHRHQLRSLSGFGSLALLADSMVFIGARMDTVVIAAIRSATAAAPFAAALKLQSGLQSLTLPFTILMMPMTSALWAEGRAAEVIRRMTLATRVAVQLTLPVAVGFALFATDLVDAWLGSDAAGVTASIVVLLMASQAVTLSTVPAEKALIGIGKVRLVGLLAAVEGLLNLAISIALVFSYGAVGAAIGTLITGVGMAPIKVPIACRALGAPVGSTLWSGYGRAVLSSLPGLTAMTIIALVLRPGSERLILGLTVGIGTCAIVALRQVGFRRLRTILRRGFERGDEDGFGPPGAGEPKPFEV